MRLSQDKVRDAAVDAVDLVVFSDDWGRHPSSCQHLVRELLSSHRVFWVNTIGTRRPTLDLFTLRRGIEKMLRWATPATSPEIAHEPNLRVLEPIMWPSFRSLFGRRLNRWILNRAVERALPQGRRRIAITTLPLVADLIGALQVDRWIYYCVDDLSSWPGLDRRSLEALEKILVGRVDAVVAVSDTLVERMAGLGRTAELLTHGIDPEHWSDPPATASQPALTAPAPHIVFWGVVDRRLETAWLEHLSRSLESGSILLVGPHNNPDPAILSLPNVSAPGPLPYGDLPALARSASVLVMPYIDAPVTRAMQPLKLKEYLATGKPVVTRDLPAVAEWQDTCDVVSDAREFAQRVLLRSRDRLPPAQLKARSRLRGESWRDKAALFEQMILNAASREGRRPER